MADEDVAVLGLGKMGSALARCLLAAGLDVRVWNRTPEKAEPLRASGASVADDPRDAVSGCDVVVVCLAEHAHTEPVLREADLAGRCVVQLTAGSPAESQALAAWLESRGALFVEGQIMVYPDAIGTDEARIMYAGSRSAMARSGVVTRALGGAVDLGDMVGSVSGLAVASRTAYAAASVATTLAIEVARAYGASVESAFTEIDLLHDVAVDGVRRSLGEDGPVVDAAAAVTIERLAAGVASLAEAAESAGLDAAVLQSGYDALARAIAAGHADRPIGFLAGALHRPS